MNMLEKDHQEQLEQIVIDEAASERGKIVSSTGMIIVNRKRGVFLYQRDEQAPKWKLSWQFPAGGRKTETLKQCARREMREEVSWAPEELTLVGLLSQGDNEEKATFWVEVSDEDADKLQLNLHPENVKPHGAAAQWWLIRDAKALPNDKLTPGTAALLHTYGEVIEHHAFGGTIPTFSELGLIPATK